MKYYIPNEFKSYKFIMTSIYTIFIMIILILSIYFNLLLYIKITITVIFCFFFINSLIYFFKFDTFQKNSYTLFENKVLKYNVNNMFLFRFKEIIIPTRNIVNFSIKQGIILKKFGISKFVISCGSSYISIHISECDVKNIEDVLINCINANIKKIGENYEK